MELNNSFENFINNAEIIFHDDPYEIEPAEVPNYAYSNVEDEGENHEDENDHSDVNGDGSCSSDKENETKSKRKVNKRLRMVGKKYVGYRTLRNQKRTYQDIDRSERTIKEKRKSKFCERSTNKMCNEISEIVRKQIFSHFWNYNMNWNKKKLHMQVSITEMYATPNYRGRKIKTYIITLLQFRHWRKNCSCV